MENARQDCHQAGHCARLHHAPAGHSHPILRHLLVGLVKRMEPSLVLAFVFHLIEKAKGGKGGACCCVPLVGARRVLLPRRGVQVCGSVHRRGSSAHVLSGQSCALSSFADRVAVTLQTVFLSRDTRTPLGVGSGGVGSGGVGWGGPAPLRRRGQVRGSAPSRDSSAHVLSDLNMVLLSEPERETARHRPEKRQAAQRKQKGRGGHASATARQQRTDQFSGCRPGFQTQRVLWGVLYPRVLASLSSTSSGTFVPGAPCDARRLALVSCAGYTLEVSMVSAVLCKPSALMKPIGQK